MIERGFGASHVKNILETVDGTPGNKPDRTVYEKDNMRVVVDDAKNALLSVVRLRRK
jgi:hypothetical protein